MKKVFVWACMALFLGTFALTSCSKDDDKDSGSSSEKRDRARYTIMVYGNAGGRMDFIIEDMWDQLKPMLNDSTDIRMVFLYKYGDAESVTPEHPIRYGKPGSVSWFELSSKTDLENLCNTDAIKAPDFQLYNPYILSTYIDAVKDSCPADNYIFILWGHGGGYDITNDAPNNIISKGVLYDELDEGKGMSMYEFADGLAEADNAHFQLLMFHNCLMGNIENITEVQQYADYFFVSSHVLNSSGEPIVELVRTLQSRRGDYDFEKIAKQMYTNLRPVYDQLMTNPEDPITQNQDHKIIRSSDITVLNYYLGELANRLVELYSNPAKAALIDSASAHYLYCYNINNPYMIDLGYYVDRLAYYVNDSKIQGLATAIQSILDEAIIQDWNYNYPHPEAGGQTSGLDRYSLSIVLGHHDFMHFVLKGNTLSSAYYPSAFNRRTGWANWLNTNTYWPDIRKSPQGGISLSWEAYRDALNEIFN